MMFQAAQQVKLLSEETMRQISPIQCNGPKCAVALSSSRPMFPVGPSGPIMESFMFKEKNIDNNELSLENSNSPYNINNLRSKNLRRAN